MTSRHSCDERGSCGVDGQANHKKWRHTRHACIHTRTFSGLAEHFAFESTTTARSNRSMMVAITTHITTLRMVEEARLMCTGRSMRSSSTGDHGKVSGPISSLELMLMLAMTLSISSSLANSDSSPVAATHSSGVKGFVVPEICG